MTDEPLVRVEGLRKHFSNESGLLAGFDIDLEGDGFPLSRDREWVRAVDDVSFEIRKGETLGLVGESGCGKSTLGRTVLQLLEPTEGSIYFQGEDITALDGEQLRSKRVDMQMIFQDPQSSLDPRQKVGPIIEEPMRAHGLYDETGREERARELLEKVGLDPQHYNRYPHAFSGGQRQRVNLARALSVNPDFIVCDEPTSSLDVSIQAQVLNTMRELQDEFGLTYLFISHDLSVIRHISDRVAVMYLGRLAEVADKEELFENPRHPYTRALFDSIPVPDPRESEIRGALEGDVPSPIDPPSGCRFRTRCPKLIAPTEYDFSANEWDEIRTFVREVDRHGFEAESESAVIAKFFSDGIPDGRAGETVEQCLSLVVDDEWEVATRKLQAAFTDRSLCATAEPSAHEVPTEHGSNAHWTACHLHLSDEERTALETEARDATTNGRSSSVGAEGDD